MYFVDACVAVGRSPKADVAHLPLERIEELYRRHGIACGLAWHVLAREYDAATGNAELLKLIDGRPLFRPLPAVSLNHDPASDPVAEQVRRLGARAVIAFPKEHGYEFDPWVVGPWLRKLRQDRIALWVNVNEAGLPALVRALGEYPELTVVLLGTRYHDYAMLRNALRALPNVWLDLSQHHLFDGVRRAAAEVGAGRLVFGSGLPGFSPGSPKYQLLRGGLSPEETAAVGHGNLERLLGLEPATDQAGAEAPFPCPLVDLHAHAGTWPRYSMVDEPREWVVEAAEREGVAAAAINTIFYGYRPAGNDRTAALCALRPGRWFGLATVSPVDPPEEIVAELARCERMGFRGVKIYPPHDQIPVIDPRYAPILRFADERGWIALYHSVPEKMLEAAARWPRVRFVLGHSVANREAMELARAIPNVYVEVCSSTRPREDWRRGLNELPADKIVFGSDLTLIDPAAMAGAVMDLVDDPDRQRAILRDNGARLLGIPPPEEFPAS